MHNEASQENPWIPVGERLPDQGKTVEGEWDTERSRCRIYGGFWQMDFSGSWKSCFQPNRWRETAKPEPKDPETAGMEEIAKETALEKLTKVEASPVSLAITPAEAWWKAVPAEVWNEAEDGEADKWEDVEPDRKAYMEICAQAVIDNFLAQQQGPTDEEIYDALKGHEYAYQVCAKLRVLFAASNAAELARKDEEIERLKSAVISANKAPDLLGSFVDKIRISHGQERMAWAVKEQAQTIELMDLHEEISALKASLAMAQKDANEWELASLKQAEEYCRLEQEHKELREKLATAERSLYHSRQDNIELTAKHETLRQKLANLLARIHRDGGHYLSTHGLDKACTDADVKVAVLNADADEARLAKPAMAEQEPVMLDNADWIPGGEGSDGKPVYLSHPTDDEQVELSTAKPALPADWPTVDEVVTLLSVQKVNCGANEILSLFADRYAAIVAERDNLTKQLGYEELKAASARARTKERSKELDTTRELIGRAEIALRHEVYRSHAHSEHCAACSRSSKIQVELEAFLAPKVDTPAA